MLSRKTCKVVTTRDLSGQENGWLMEIASSRDGWSKFLDNAQVYLTTVLPGKKKGGHFHHKRTSQISCIRGRVIMGVWHNHQLNQEMELNANEPVIVRVPNGTALSFYNPGGKVAYLLNLCSPPYDPDDSEQEDLDILWEPKV